MNNYLFLTMHSNVTIKNVSWPHFSWATLCTCWFYHCTKFGLNRFGSFANIKV